MNCTFVVNHIDEITPEQTTSMLIETACRRGHIVAVAELTDLGIQSDGTLVVQSRTASSTDFGDRTELLDRIRRAPRRPAPARARDVLVLRTNPGRDEARRWAHDALLTLAAHAQRRGVIVVNDPLGMRRIGSKLSVMEFPATVRPATIVTRDPEAVRDFVADHDGIAVLKPMVGSRGAGVFLLRESDSTNHAQILEMVARDGFAVVQEYLPEAPGGDTRVLLLDGEALRVGDQLAAVSRVPPVGEFRSNVALGGRPVSAQLSDRDLETVRAVGPLLRDEGLLLVGLDLVGGRVVELNVHSTGGLVDANRFYGVDFTVPIVAALEGRVELGLARTRS